MKVCTKCGIEKDESEFTKDSGFKGGLKARCKACVKSSRKKQKTNLVYQHEYYLKNIEKKKRDARQRYKNNIADKRIKSKIYYDNNKIKKQEYRSKNKSVIIKRTVEYTKKRKTYDNAFKAKTIIASSFRKTLLRQNIKKSDLLNNYTMISYTDYIVYFEQNFPVEFSQITEKGKYHIDHIIPCAVYDFNNPEEIKLCWQPENLRIIPAKENLEKSDKLDFDLIEKHNIWHLLPDRLKQKTA